MDEQRFAREAGAIPTRLTKNPCWRANKVPTMFVIAPARREITLQQAQVGAIEKRAGEIWLDGQGLVVTRGGFDEVSLFKKSQAEIVVTGGLMRIEAQCLPITVHGLGQLSLGLQGVTEIEMSP